MLVFNRAAFKSGVIKVEEPDTTEGAPEGAMKATIFKPSDKGHDFAALDETYMLAHYPVLFTVKP